MKPAIVLKNKIKHFREEPVYCHAISNNCIEKKWHIFFDVDNVLAIEGATYIESLSIKTKHGIQLIGSRCLTLSAIKAMFDELKAHNKTDYFWSVPLWLRYTSKESVSGKILSPAPEYPNEFLNHFPIRKLYKTWI